MADDKLSEILDFAIEREKEAAAFYRQLAEQNSPVQVFEPHRPEGPGPRVFLYQLCPES